jgi:8-oxo-dGTP pyrophosphatase MutT (NUDIX family)
MKWKALSERVLYQDQWVHVGAADVELPDGRHLDHRIVHTGAGAGAVVTNADRVLLIWRHRFITNTWTWEIPLGGLEPGEDPQTAAAREVEEETGWRPGPLRPMVYTQPSPGLMTSEHHVFRADSAVFVGTPEQEKIESQRVEWVPIADIHKLIDQGDIVTGTSLVALLYLLAEGTTSTR